MNAVVSTRKEVKLQPNAERNGVLDVSTYSGHSIDAYVYSVRKVRGVRHSSMLAAAHAPTRECCVFYCQTWTSASGMSFPESWALHIGTASFPITKAEADKLIAEFGLTVEGNK
jgi:hypothetical protein